MNMTPTTSSTWGSRCVLIALVLTLATFLLGVSTPTARAAPPGVVPSENPVMIDLSTKKIDLAWTLAPFQVGKLTVTASGTPTPVLDKTVSSFTNTGSEPLTVTYPKTYIAKLTDAFTNQPVGAPVTITTKKIDTSAPADPCVLHVCITSVDVVPHGGWAQFTIKSNKPAITTLKASTKPPNAEGTWSSPNDVAASAGSILPTQNWAPVLKSLVPNTTYHYVVRAHGTDGHEQIKTGTFKTLKQRVDVTFAEIKMIDDSDGAGAGDCDCWFYFNAGNETPKMYGDVANQKSIASGTTVHPNITIATNPPSPMRIRAMGYDDDQDFGEYCTVPHPEAHTGGASWETTGNKEECVEWAGGQADVFIPSEGPDTPPSTVGAFTISVSGELVYTVHGTYKVTYVP